MFFENEYRHVIEHVDAYLHEVLPTAESRYVEQHCAQCPVCEAALHEARKRQAALESVPPLEASERLIQKTLTTIDRAEQSQSRQRRLLTRCLLPAAGLAALLLLCCHLYFLNLSPSTYEIQVLGQNQLLAATTSSLRIRLFDRNSGKALPGIPVRVDLLDAAGGAQQLAAFKTDAEGTGQPRLQLPDWADGDYRLRVTAATGWNGSEAITEKITLKRSWKLMLTADKPVYQPGQQMHVRSLALRRPDLKPVASREVTFSIVDPKGNVIFKRKDLTSKYGIAAIDCPLASEIIEGPYTIACRVGDTESKQTVEVKKYVLPKFKVEVTPDQRYYQPGQKVRGKVQADYFFGKPVADAEVQLRVLSTGDRELRELKLKTDGQGTAAFEFPVPDQLTARLQDDGDARLVLQANVTDPANQKQSRSVSRIVTAQPLKIEVIPETGALVQDIVNRVYLFVSYPDGQPAAQARVMVSDRDQELVTGSLGVAAYEVTPRSASLSLTVKARDANDNVGRRTVALECGRGTNDFIVRTDKAVYNGGETMRVSVLGGGGQPVFLDFIKDGQTALTEVVPVQQGSGEYQFDLPADLFGTVEMVAYRYHAAGVPVRKSRVLYIRQAEELKIAATLDHQEYRPGAQAKLKLQLSDKHGKPTPGALSLSAVDEAVYAVLDQLPGMEKVFFSLEQKLLEPVYNLFPWSPDLVGGLNDGNRAQFEQALFARTWQQLDNRPTEIKKIHSLEGSSQSQSHQHVEAVKASGLKWVNTGWLVFVGLLVGAGLVHLCVLVQPVQRAQAWLVEWEESRKERRAQEGGFSTGFLAATLFACLLVLVFLTSVQLLGKNSSALFMTVASSITGSASPTAAVDADVLVMRAGRRDAALETRPEEKVLEEPRIAPPPTAPEPKTDPAGGVPDEQPAAPVRIREFFPETLLWKPEVITDDQGRASVNIELADSITTWRLSASAVTADGRLGASLEPIKVFQPFFVDLNLPISLTRGDEVTVPAVIYNYLSKPQTVTLDLQAEGWFTLLNGESTTREVELRANEQKEVRFMLKATKVGFQSLTVKAQAGKVGDALKRIIEIVPDGQRVERVVNGSLQRAVDLNLAVPQAAIEGSPRLFLKVYPSNFSQLVEGLDNIFRLPSGCFEQTSSTTYPNILALDYLRRTGKSAPDVEKKARQYIHLGYQRLLGFEVQGGGFDWYGRPPANRTLTAYGLMEFVDMAKVHEVDPNLIARTRQWLLEQQRPDGSWPADQAARLAGNAPHSPDADYATTAYIGWAVFEGQPGDGDRALAVRQFLLQRPPQAIHNSYLLALTCNALLSLEAASAQPYLKRLEELKRTSVDGKLAWWGQADGQRTMFHGAGQSGAVETTALATLALLRGNGNPGTIGGALAWLVQQKDASGTWHSTQATVLALKALLAGTAKPVGREQDRVVVISLGDTLKRKLLIPADQSDVMQLLDLTEHLQPGDNKLTVNETTATGAGYQVAFRYHLPATEKPAAQAEPLAIHVDYDQTDVNVNDVVRVKATVRNRMNATAPMVMVELPIPAGFTPGIDELVKLAEKGVIGKMQVTGRQIIVYLRGLEPGQPLELKYQLRAVLPVKVTAPAARVYEYYDPAKQSRTEPVAMTVRR